ncbi:MAG: flavin reductase [Elusimicrobiaceae bacterium]|nr:flavin reductase [Elusimicrobiaceae bacterium]
MEKDNNKTKIKNVAYDYGISDFLAQLNKGAFLTTQYAGENNVMTIGWAQIGMIWSKPVMTVLVRKSRYTKGLIDGSKEFTISVPLNCDKQKELAYCGTVSGKDENKFDTQRLKLLESEKINTPCLDMPGLHYECMVLYRTEIKLSDLDEIVNDTWYHDGDTHTIYVAEIVNTRFVNK